MPNSNRTPWSFLLLGVALAGFIDGILFHQVLQWHHMVSNERSVATVAGLEANTLGDGVFHLATLVVAVLGVALLVADAIRGRLRGPRARWVGLLLIGAGGFNVVEGLVDHHILRLHHVREGSNELAYDLTFLAVSAVILVAGLALAQRPRVISRLVPAAR